MNVSITRVDNSLPMPEYHTSGAVAFDIYSRVDMIAKPQELAFIPSNLIVHTPHDYMLAVLPRSSTPKKKGLLIPHGVGVIDPDFQGPNDEIHVQVYNFAQEEVAIARGERIAQGLFIKIERAVFTEEATSGESRGGFGTTGS